MILGKNLIVSLNGTPIAAAKSCRISVAQDFIQACAPDSGRVMTKIPTSYDWSISVDCLISNTNTAAPGVLINALLSGQVFLLTFTEGSGQKYAGNCYVKSCEEGGSIGNLATFSVAFESSGALFKYTEYKTAEFQDGDGVEIFVADNTVTYDFESRQANTYGVSITPMRAAKLRIMMDDSYAVYNMPFSNVKAILHNQVSAALSVALVACGSTIGMEVNLMASTEYTILMNDHSSINKLYLLTE